eukprot:1148523-Pelagomonas_calceolata.AAC.3
MVHPTGMLSLSPRKNLTVQHDSPNKVHLKYYSTDQGTRAGMQKTMLRAHKQACINRNSGRKERHAGKDAQGTRAGMQKII